MPCISGSVKGSDDLAGITRSCKAKATIFLLRAPLDQRRTVYVYRYPRETIADSFRNADNDVAFL